MWFINFVIWAWCGGHRWIIVSVIKSAILGRSPGEVSGSRGRSVGDCTR